mmetsp:Transcript_14342/g.21667  ORF Transcript_14342/g.21667 Transcript_14342/m.21667 type:complete len:287 (+) Transcript_14342:42-902(+)
MSSWRQPSAPNNLGKQFEYRTPLPNLPDAPDFAAVYKPSENAYDDEEEEQEFPCSITPRMAFRLDYHAREILDQFENYHIYEFEFWDMYFPPISHSFLKKESWRLQFIAAVKRVLMRLLQGNGFHPNCTGEEMAVHLIVDRARDTFEDKEDFFVDDNKEWNKLPVYGENDEDFSLVGEIAVEDEDVLMLWQYSPSNLTQLLPDAAYLHPSKWFIAFRSDFERMHDHLSPSIVEEIKASELNQKSSSHKHSGQKRKTLVEDTDSNDWSGEPVTKKLKSNNELNEKEK